MKSKLTGWQNVYAFTFKQAIKGKGFLLVTVILCILSLASLPVLNLMNRGEGERKIESIQTVYVINDSGIPITDFSESKDGAIANADIEWITQQRTMDEVVEELEEAGENEKALLLHVTWEDEGYFQLNFIKGANSGVREGEVTRLSEAVSQYFDQARVWALDVSEEQMERIHTPIDTNVVTMDAGGEIIQDEEKEGVSLNQYNVLLAGVVLLVFMIAISGELVATSIITEKSTRLVEFLMTTIRPLAVIFGKILAMLTVTALQVGLVVISLGVSGLLSTFVMKGGSVKWQNVGTLMKEVMQMDAAAFQPLPIVISILIVIAGFLFYGTLAGLAGASVSRLDEMGEALKMYNAVLIIGSYMAIGLAITGLSGSSGVGVFQAFCYLLPFSSPFVLPANLLVGQVSIGWAIGGLAILIVSCVLLFLFVAKVYERMLFFNGSNLTWKAIWKMSREKEVTE